MTDWTKTMLQTFEYYVVDPGTWKNVSRIDSIISSSITRDMSNETLGSAKIESSEPLGEEYVRIYLVAVQNGVTEKYPLGTYLVQTPTKKFDGTMSKYALDAYSPLIELKENKPPLGYYVPKDSNVMSWVARLTSEHTRAPVVAAISDDKLYNDFVANTNDTWITFNRDLMANAKFYYDLDELGRILYAPKQDTASLQPIWTYTDDNSSIIYPEITLNGDLYGIPNVVEVIYTDKNNHYYARVVNDDENSPTSTARRGREIVHRVENPEFPGEPTQLMIQQYADQLLRELSSLESTITYKHGYNGVRLGDCIRLNYRASGMVDIKARVISQSINCVDTCPVTETAVFTKKLWR